MQLRASLRAIARLAVRVAGCDQNIDAIDTAKQPSHLPLVEILCLLKSPILVLRRAAIA
ncbi:MAG: hypothetical protein HKO71_07970 [Pseudomonadales bacterium]|nr:hypothetical protein [Gammaproteobacteria bacterium]NNL57675.1 hypothetical protein [Pseudomonadales bacterium]